MRVEKSFEVGCSCEAAAAAIASDEALQALFPDGKVEIKEKRANRRTLVTHYSALGQAGTATFHFEYEDDGSVRFSKVCDGNVWKRLEGSVRFEAKGKETRVRIEADGSTRALVPEFAIRGPMNDTISRMADALRKRLAKTER
jgi:carbon monoxide dehydrogenase subunit G